MILISEVKNQGTNDQRKAEGKKRQAQGNAIERLGKNVIGFRAAMLTEGIMPFVCFGYGCDFANDSSILDRVVTMAMFGPLNEIELSNRGQVQPGQLFLSREEMDTEKNGGHYVRGCDRSIHYYFSKYGKAAFR